jgi:hypothetical protein
MAVDMRPLFAMHCRRKRKSKSPVHVDEHQWNRHVMVRNTLHYPAQLRVGRKGADASVWHIKHSTFLGVEGKDIVQQLLEKLGIKQQVPFDFSFKNSTLHLVGVSAPLPLRI